MIFYLTFNDAPSGIYSSQVIDVAKFIRHDLESEIKLIAFISLRKYFQNRKKIKAELGDSIVVPMFPRIQNWRLNVHSLKLLRAFYKPKLIIGRSVLATQLAFGIKQSNTKIVYDGRGAIASEWLEYKVVSDLSMLSQIKELERECVINSDFRIAVSQSLVSYWNETYNFESKNFVVIPCTLNKAFINQTINLDSIESVRSELGFGQNDVVFVYSGSLAGWQSLNLINTFIQNRFSLNDNYKLLFLSESNKDIENIVAKYPRRVLCKALTPHKVPFYLQGADYGFLVREESITNKVASPVKFAEYLACGLKVIISDGIGDYTQMVSEENFGMNLKDIPEKMKRPTIDEKISLSLRAKELFAKSNYKNEYTRVLA